jgi:hypothetical protein
MNNSNGENTFINAFLFFVVLIFIGVISFVTIAHKERQTIFKEYTYHGVVVSHGYEPPTSGYKSKQDAKYFILMKEDSSGKVIRINVTIPTYHSLKVGDKTAFTISNRQLYDYGNSTDASKNLYEQ